MTKPEKDVGYYDNGQKRYEQHHVNDELHREDGPAYIEWYKNGQKWVEKYYVDDQRHRIDGPAYINWYKNGQRWHEEYWIDGEELTEQEFYRWKVKNKLEKRL